MAPGRWRRSAHWHSDVRLVRCFLFRRRQPDEFDATGPRKNLTMSLKPSINWLFVFIPITLVVEHLGQVPDPVIFLMAALSIIPIAALIERLTGHVATT